MKRIFALSALILLGAAGTSGAQSLGDRFAYSAILNTPVGAIPTSPLLALGTSERTAVSGYYTLVPQDGLAPTLRHMVAGYSLPAYGGRSTWTLGAGSCSGCKTTFEGGVDWLSSAQKGDFQVGFRPALGYARDGDNNSWAAAMSVPIAWTPAAGSGLRITPFIEPGFAVGGMWSTDSESGSRMMTSGGLVFSSADSPLSVTAGARKVFLDNGRTTFGLGVTWR